MPPVDPQYLSADSLARLHERVSKLESIVESQAFIIETHVKMFDSIQSDNSMTIFRIGQEIGALYKIVVEAREQGKL